MFQSNVLPPYMVMVTENLTTVSGHGHSVLSALNHFRDTSHQKSYFYCVSDLSDSIIKPRPLENYYEAKKICEQENSSLITSLEPNFDFARQILNFFWLASSSPKKIYNRNTVWIFRNRIFGLISNELIRYSSYLMTRYNDDRWWRRIRVLKLLLKIEEILGRS